MANSVGPPLLGDPRRWGVPPPYALAFAGFQGAGKLRIRVGIYSRPVMSGFPLGQSKIGGPVDLPDWISFNRIVHSIPGGDRRQWVSGE